MKGDKLIEKEDMNLHYVGITRAKKVCILVSSTKNHLKYKGEWVLWNAQPSNFLSINNLQKLRG